MMWMASGALAGESLNLLKLAAETEETDSLPEQIMAFAILIAAATALWALVVYIVFRLTKPPEVPEGESTTELRAELPAVVTWLTSRFEPRADAAAATFIDLVARGVIELQQTAGIHGASTCRIVNQQPAGLTAYEQRVFDHVRDNTDERGTALTALQFRTGRALRMWHRAFARDVRTHTRQLGLAKSRLGGTAAAGMAVGALTPAMVVFCVFGNLHILVGLVAAVGYMYLLWHVAKWLLVGDTYTPHGIVATSHWLGVRNYLRESPTFEDLPISAVTMWDRYLAYAAALGCAPHAASAVSWASIGDFQLPDDLRGQVPSRPRRRLRFTYYGRNVPPKEGGPF